MVQWYKGTRVQGYKGTRIQGDVQCAYVLRSTHNFHLELTPKPELNKNCIFHPSYMKKMFSKLLPGL